jgi:hypothetical protein
VSLARALRGRVVEGPNSLGERSRSRRWRAFAQRFPDVDKWHVIDLGGTPEAWLRAPVRPHRVTVLNLVPFDVPDDPWLTVVRGDACALDETLLSQSFDLVFSNSLIEHVGGDARCLDLAGAVHRLAPRHWVQTPYRYFPIEPHWLFPGMQFLPARVRAAIARSWPLAHSRATSETAIRAVLSTMLLSRTEMRHYFPDSEILSERIGPFVKSLIAVKD